MPVDPSAMLFLPPQPPVPIPDGGAVVVGRSRSCELTLRSPDASRRHAEIVAVQDGYLIRDLGSTNGSWVNGQRVEQQRLSPGDRIEIGGEILTFCVVDPALEQPDTEDPAENVTLMVERRAFGESIRGSLAEVPPFALLQMLEMGRKTGMLEIDGGELGRAVLWLAKGEPAHAETKTQRGFDAAIAIVNCSSGQFSFEPGREAPENTIAASATELLLEASRVLDETR